MTALRAPDKGTFYIDRFGLGANHDSPNFPSSPLVVSRRKDHLHIGPAQDYPANGFVKTNPTIPPGYRVTGVSVCYSLTKPGPGPGSAPPSEITRLRLAQFAERLLVRGGALTVEGSDHQLWDDDAAQAVWSSRNVLKPETAGTLWPSSSIWCRNQHRSRRSMNTRPTIPYGLRVLVASIFQELNSVQPHVVISENVVATQTTGFRLVIEWSRAGGKSRREWPGRRPCVPPGELAVRGDGARDAQDDRIPLSVHLATSGEHIFVEGDPRRDLYLLVAGRVKCYRATPEGREQVLKGDVLHDVRP